MDNVADQFNSVTLSSSILISLNCLIHLIHSHIISALNCIFGDVRICRQRYLVRVINRTVPYQQLEWMFRDVS